MADSLRALVPPGLATRPGPRMDQMPQGSRAPLAGTRVNNHQLFFQPSLWAWSHSRTWESVGLWDCANLAELRYA